MENDIISFVSDIRKNTGIGIDLYSERGESIAGEDKTVVTSDFTGVYSDKTSGKTLFKFRYKNKAYIGGLSGTDAAAKNYAYLICELAEQSFAKSNLNKEEFFKSALFGEASYYTIKKYSNKYFKNGKVCAMLIAAGQNREKEVLEVVKSYTDGSSDFVCGIEDGLLAMVKFSDEENGEYRSVSEYAEFLAQSIYEETGETVGIFIGGTIESVADLALSFSQAISAHRISGELSRRSGVHSFKEFLIVKMLEDLPKIKLTEYLKILLEPSARDIFDDKEMITTAEEFLENSLNISETARKLFLHRNTLNYRLDKIERVTGLDIRRVSDAITFKMIMIILKLVR